MKTRFNTLDSHLRQWGLNVVTHEGWRYNGRPWSSSFRPKAVICHHTASGSKSGNFASEGIVINGRGSSLPGPLCQFLLGRDGTVKIITGNGSNHAGTGGPWGVVRRNLGNYDAFGIEAENNGVGEHWSNEQLQAYYRLCAALLDLMGTKDVNHRVLGHKEYTSRKIDPNGINMNDFRRQVDSALNHGSSRQVVNLPNLKYGANNAGVLKVKKALAKKGYKGINTTNGIFGLGLRRAYSAYQRSLGYRGSDANGMPGRTSLESLGFKVIDVAPKASNQTVSLKNLRFGYRSNDARLVKQALYNKGYRNLEAGTDYWGPGAVACYSAWQRKLGYRGSDADGIPGTASLKKLGFTVK